MNLHVANSCRAIEAFDLLRTGTLGRTCQQNGCMPLINGTPFNESMPLTANFSLSAIWDTSGPAGNSIIGCAIEHACNSVGISLDAPQIPSDMQSCFHLDMLLSGTSPPQRKAKEDAGCSIPPIQQSEWLYSQLAANLTSSALTLGRFCTALSVSRHSYKVQAARKAAGGQTSHVLHPDRHRWERATNFSAAYSSNTCETVSCCQHSITLPLSSLLLRAGQRRRHPIVLESACGLASCTWMCNFCFNYGGQ